MRSSGPQLAPDENPGAAAMSIEGPPAAGIRFRRPSAKNPIHLPSHEKNGLEGPGAGEWRRIETIERSAIQPPPALVTGRDDDRPAVRRHGNRRRVAGSAGHAH